MPADKLLFLNDDRLATIAQWDKNELIWDLKSGKRIGQINFSHPTRPDQMPIAFSGNGKVAAYFRGNQLYSRVTDSQDGTFIGTPESGTPFHQGALTLACSPYGKEATFPFESLGKQHYKPGTWKRKLPPQKWSCPPQNHSLPRDRGVIPIPVFSRLDSKREGHIAQIKDQEWNDQFQGFP